jgi:2-haloacid dehalogenase
MSRSRRNREMVTGDALDFALETLGIDRPGIRDRLMTLYI